LQDLTGKQAAIYEYVRNYHARHGYSPSREEIAKEINIHISTLRYHLFAMEKKKLLTWNERIPRSITLIPPAKKPSQALEDARC